jgi:deoxyribodipyrimidine photo-lyase
MTAKISVFLFRNNLRLHDQPFEVVKHFAHQMLCLFLWPEPRSWLTTAPPVPLSQYREAALHNALAQLQEGLSQRGQVLYLYRGIWERLPLILGSFYSAPVIYLEREPFPEEMALEEFFRKSGLEVHSYDGRTLLHPDDLPIPLKKLPRYFTPFRHRVERALRVRESIPIPHKLPSPPSSVPKEFKPFSHRQILLPSSSSLPQGTGEYSALRHIENYTSPQGALRHYKKTRNGFMGLDFSSKLSVFLALGSLSPRVAWHKIEEYEARHGATEDTYWLKFELLWRDFFRFQAMNLGKSFFGRSVAYRLYDETQQTAFDNWKRGRTGDGLVDAAMRELTATGYMSNRARQNAASYLIHELGLPWEAGAAWFEHCLLDYDPASNYGNWSYIAGVRFDPRGGRRFNTVDQAARYDPDCLYRKKWLAEI